MTDEAKKEYKTRLVASVDCIRWLLKQGLPFRGNDESKKSLNRGNFLELLQFFSDHNEDVRRVALENAPPKIKLIAPCIQKDIVRACAFETTDAIMRELGDSFFSVLIDESRDVLNEEQMAVVLRFVDMRGCVVERLLGFQHVTSTTTRSLKNALETLLNLRRGIDMQLQVLNNRFNGVSSELLLCVACLNPSNGFVAFDKKKLTQLTRFYPYDFSEIELLALSDQLETFVMDTRLNIEELELKGIGDITKKMVETRRDVAYPLVYKLFTLALVLPVATAIVERAFSAMKIIKNRFRNRMSDGWMNDNLFDCLY